MLTISKMAVSRVARGFGRSVNYQPLLFPASRRLRIAPATPARPVLNSSIVVGSGTVLIVPV
jgi:hypothetical protein